MESVCLKPVHVLFAGVLESEKIYVVGAVVTMSSSVVHADYDYDHDDLERRRPPHRARATTSHDPFEVRTMRETARTRKNVI